VKENQVSVVLWHAGNVTHVRNCHLPASTGVRSFSALLTRGFRRVGLDDGTCGGCGCTNGMDSFPPAPSVLRSL